MGKGLGMHNGIWEQLCGAQAIGDQGGFLERAALHSAPKHSEQREGWCYRPGDPPAQGSGGSIQRAQLRRLLQGLSELAQAGEK